MRTAETTAAVRQRARRGGGETSSLVSLSSRTPAADIRDPGIAPGRAVPPVADVRSLLTFAAPTLPLLAGVVRPVVVPPRIAPPGVAPLGRVTMPPSALRHSIGGFARR